MVAHVIVLDGGVVAHVIVGDGGVVAHVIVLDGGECSYLIVAVDHRPLLKILGDRSLDVITNTRLRNTKEKTLRYRFRFSGERWSRGRAPDCQSRGRWFNPICRFET